MKNTIKALCLLLTVVSISGCSLIPVALSAAAAYGIYQSTQK